METDRAGPSGVDWDRNRPQYTLKTNNKGEYFSLGIAPASTTQAQQDGKELFTSWCRGRAGRTPLDFDLKKEQTSVAKGQGLPPEQVAKAKEARQSREGKKYRRRAE